MLQFLAAAWHGEQAPHKTAALLASSSERDRSEQWHASGICHEALAYTEATLPAENTPGDTQVSVS